MAKAAATALRVEKRDVGLYLIVTGIVAALGMVYIGVSSALSSTCTAGHAGPKGCTFSISFVALIVAAVVTESAGLIAVGLRRQAGWSYFGLRRVAFKPAAVAVGWGLVLVAGMTLIQSLLARYIPLFGVSQFDFGDQAPLADLVVFGLFAVLAAPVIEEIFFRGILLRALWSKLSFGVAAVLSSALFAAVHGLNGATISIFIFALYLSYMYRRLGSIVPGMALHAINNAIAFAVLAVTGKA
jgi:membrane protease YdiL (CAAX protease family)